MSVRLFVGNLPYDVTETELRELFSAAGHPSLVRVPTDRETGKPRGFAFVEFAERSQAEDAIRRFDRQLFKGRPLAVNEARPREAGGAQRSPERPPRPGDPSSAPRGGPAPEIAREPWEPAKRGFGPDARPQSKRKKEPRAPDREEPPKGRPRHGPRVRPNDHEEDGPDEFDIWRAEDKGDAE